MFLDRVESRFLGNEIRGNFRWTIVDTQLGDSIGGNQAANELKLTEEFFNRAIPRYLFTTVHLLPVRSENFIEGSEKRVNGRVGRLHLSPSWPLLRPATCTGAG